MRDQSIHKTVDLSAQEIECILDALERLSDDEQAPLDDHYSALINRFTELNQAIEDEIAPFTRIDERANDQTQQPSRAASDHAPVSWF